MKLRIILAVLSACLVSGCVDDDAADCADGRPGGGWFQPNSDDSSAPYQPSDPITPPVYPRPYILPDVVPPHR